MRVAYNDDNDDLWCVECKCKINLFEKYVVIKEDYCDEKVEKCYHPECLPEMEDDD